MISQQFFMVPIPQLKMVWLAGPLRKQSPASNKIEITGFNSFYADTIMGRLIHHAQRFALQGGSLRKMANDLTDLA